MNVKLISHTPDPEKIIYTAAKTCYSKKTGSELLEKPFDEKAKKLITNIVSRGHHSVIEHAAFTFSIEGISRACSHQLVRHRVASFSQQSQRYVSLAKLPHIVPPTIEKNEEAKRLFDSVIGTIKKTYQNLIELGIPKEDSRFVLPNATETNIILTMNARSLLHFFELRCCLRAQWEIRELAWLMLEEVKRVAPIIFKDAGPWCIGGDCPEDDKACEIQVKEKMKKIIGQ